MALHDVSSTLEAFKTAIDSFDDTEDNELFVLANCSAADASSGAATKERTLAGLLARLSTYASLAWSVKPPEVSPLVCAQHGWIAQDVDLLCCVTCRSNLCIQLPASSVLYQRYVGETVAKLSSSHDGLCPWRLISITGGDFPVLQFNSPAANLATLASIADRLAPIAAGIDDAELLQFDIPLCSPVAEELLALLVHQRRDEPPAMQQDASSSEDLQLRLRRRCLQLAVTGWAEPPADQPSRSPQRHRSLSSSGRRRRVLGCRFCQRRLGVWNLARLAQRQLRRDGDGGDDVSLDGVGALLATATANESASQSEEPPANESASQSDLPANESASQSEEPPANESASQSEEPPANESASQSEEPPANCESASQSEEPQPPSAKRLRLSPPPAAAADASSVPASATAPSLPLLRLDPLGLHWRWCPWRSGAATDAWCRSALHAAAAAVGSREPPPTPTRKSAAAAAASPAAVPGGGVTPTEACAKVAQLLRCI